MKNISIKILSYLLLLGTAIIHTEIATAQEVCVNNKPNKTAYNAVSGVVVDEKAEPLTGAQILVIETRTGTCCNIDGYFIIDKIKLNKYHIKVSFIGYEDKIIEINGSKTNLKISLNEEKAKLNSVICKANINSIDLREKSGVVDKVKMSTLKDKPMIDIGLALQGAVPGLVVSPRGVLGEKPVIRIRGNSSLRPGDSANEPLYVLDGKIISSETFMLLNPIDIQSIKVLKDAAACALYGIKAANGVIEITSVRGTKGPMQITLSSDIGIAMKGRRPLRMMDSKEKLEYERLSQCNNAPGYLLSKEYIEQWVKQNKFAQLQNIYNYYFNTDKNISEQELKERAEIIRDSLSKINTDWFNKILKNTLYQSHYLSIRGGNDNINYYSSVSYNNQKGQLPNNSFNRYQANLSIDWNIKNIGYVSLSASGAVSKKSTPNNSSYSLESMIYNLNSYESPLTKKLFSYKQRTYKDLFNQYSSQSQDISNSIQLSTNLHPIQCLEIGGIIGIDLNYYNNKRIKLASSYDEQHNGVEDYQKGYISEGKSIRKDITANFRVTFNKLFAQKHDVTISSNVDYYYGNYDGIDVTGYGTGNLTFIGAANQGIDGNRRPHFSPSKNQNAQIGYGLSLGYTYNCVIDLFSTIKRDASSILPKKYRWNTAWAIGAGIHWNELKFLKSDVLTDLTTRFSYGYISNLSGVQKSETVPVFSYSTEYYNQQRNLEMTNMYNSKLRPEQTSSLELGLSIGLFGRHFLQVQAYRRYIADALLDVPIPSSMGYGIKKENIGKLINKGIEISLSSNVYQSKNLYINLRGNMAYNNNLVISLYDKDALYTSDSSIIPEYKVGQSYNLLWGWQSLGINPQNGLPYLKTNTGEEKPLSANLTRNDLKILGRSEPPITGSIGGNIRYRSFDFDIQFYYTLGGVKGSSFEYIRDRDNAYKNAPKGLLDRTWFNAGDEDRIYPSPQISTVASNNFRLYPNSRMLVSTSFIKCSSFAIKYRLPEYILRKYTHNIIKFASLSVKGSNIFMITPYNDGSPEAVSTKIATQPVISFNTTLTF